MKINNQKGFSLVEVIIVLIITGIMGSYLITFVQSSTQNSIEPILMTNERANLQEEMEKITQEYKKRLKAGNFSLADFKTGYVDGRSLVLASETSYVKFKTGEDAMLLVTLQSGNQKIWSLFAE
ncbi:type II secretion system protein [uncultured Desulfobacter sp.]|uniref:type II secretion system protein n=1 Tax=uncultured Desulfobacter sp. TaxID=240139 RepID=UPI002AAB40EE|nr:type II secretion system protein [uncultured Desulfobacter sp.]